MLSAGVRVHVPPILDHCVDVSQALAYQERHDFGTIVRDKELFWALFCNSMSQVHSANNDVTCRKERSIVTLSARNHTYEGIKNSVEDLRELVEVGFNEKRAVVILPIKSTDLTFIREPSPTPIIIDHSRSEIASQFFKGCIQPVMPVFIKALQAKHIPQTVTQETIAIIGGENFPGTKRIEDAFSIEWDKKVHLIYPIPPQKPVEGPDLRSVLYAWYKQQETSSCDFTLVDKNGESIKIHSAVLHAYGAEAFQRLLSQSMVEAKEKTITFPDFTKDVLELFAEYLYLGPAAFTEVLYAKEVADGFALFEFASVWGIQPLVDCATNLISLADLEGDEIDRVEALAEKHNNAHLKKLVEHLRRAQVTDPITHEKD